MDMALQCMSGKFPVRGMDIRFRFFVVDEDADEDAAEALSLLSLDGLDGNSFEISRLV